MYCKSLLLLLAVLLSFSAKSQEYDVPTPLEFKRIDSSVTASKAELFSRAKAFIAVAFKSANSVIQLSDPEAGKIIGKGIFTVNARPMGMGNKFYVSYMITIDVRDGKYRCILSNYSVDASTYKTIETPFSIEGAYSPGNGLFKFSQKMYNNIRDDVYLLSLSFIREMKGYMRLNDSKVDADGF